MKVYRLEDKDRNGPYGKSETCKNISALHPDCYRVHCGEYSRYSHPSPYEEDIHIDGRKCAFTSLKGLVKWFDDPKGLLKRAVEAGYLIACYEVPVEDVECGLIQCTVIKEAFGSRWLIEYNEVPVNRNNIWYSIASDYIL